LFEIVLLPRNMGLNKISSTHENTVEKVYQKKVTGFI